MTPQGARKAKDEYDEYRFKTLLSVLTEEQRKQFDTSMKENLSEYKSKISKFLAPRDVEDILDQLKKVENFG